MLNIYLRDWFFNAGIVGFLSIFGETLEEVKENGINIYQNYIEFDEKILKDFRTRFNKHLLKYFITDNLLDELINSLENEEKVKKFKSTDWDSANFKLLRKLFSSVGIGSLDDLKAKRVSAVEILRNAKKNKYFDTAAESYDLITSRFINFLGSNSVQVWVTDGDKKIKKADHTVILNALDECTAKIAYPDRNAHAFCAMCGGVGAEYEYNSTASAMGGLGDSFRSWRQQDILICPKCRLVYACGFIALSKARNAVYYFADINTSVKKLFEYNMQLKHIEENAKSLAGYVEKLIELEKLDINRRDKSSFQFIRTDKNDMLGRPGYNLFQYHITPKQVEFLNKFNPPSGNYRYDEKKTIYLRADWLEKVMLLSLSYNDLAQLFQASVRKKINNVFLSYAVRYVAAFYKHLRGADMSEKINTEKKEIDVVGWGIATGAKAKQYVEKAKPHGEKAEFENLAYSLLTSLKTENINEFLNIYMRFLMSYKLSPEFPVGILKDKDKFVQYGYAFLAGLLQGDRTDNDKKDDNEIEEG
jgi:CRISPR-associated protein Cst1